MRRLVGITSSDIAGPRALFLNLSLIALNFGLFFLACSYCLFGFRRDAVTFLDRSHRLLRQDQQRAFSLAWLRQVVLAG